MHNILQPFMDNFSEYNERGNHHVSVESIDVSTPKDEKQLFLDYLLEQGFEWEEASKLIALRENLYDNTEMRQRMADDSRMLFARWLYEHGEISEAGEIAAA